jgi:hypothetical protein
MKKLFHTLITMAILISGSIAVLADDEITGPITKANGTNITVQTSAGPYDFDLTNYKGRQPKLGDRVTIWMRRHVITKMEINSDETKDAFGTSDAELERLRQLNTTNTVTSLSDAELRQLMVGRWTTGRHDYDYKADGTWRMLPADISTTKGTWRVENHQLIEGTGARTIMEASRKQIVLKNEGDTYPFRYVRIGEKSGNAEGGSPLTTAGSSGLSAAPKTDAPTETLSNEKGLRSVTGNVKTRITFVNRSQQPVKAYWLDYEGERVFYKELKPSESYSLDTFVTHPWLITDLHDNAWDIYMPTVLPRTVIIRAPKKR